MNHDTPASQRLSLRSVKVWDIPTRVFHWLLAFSFSAAYLTSESERYRDWHVMFGYTVAALIVFRLIWGIAGTRYARFSSFIFSPSRVLEYLRSLLSSSPKHYLGHNPAGAVAIFLLLGLSMLTACSGFATYQEIGGEWVEELHEGCAATMLAVVAVHIVGVVTSSLLHRENLVRSMFSGNKSGPADQAIRKTRPLVGIILLVAVLGFWSADRFGWLPVSSDVAVTQQHNRHDHD